MSETTTLAPSDEYFAQMASSLGDKSRLASHLVPGTVADIGAGGGELANYLGISASTWIDHVYAADVSPEALARIRALKSDPHQMRQIRPELDPADIPHNERLTVVEGSFTAAFEAAEGQVDNIVLSSVLHEVYSYGEGGPGRRVERVIGALGLCMRALQPGGRLVIRDGVKPARDRMDIAIDGPGVWGMVKVYAESSSEGRCFDEAARVGDRGELVLTADLAAEFLLTATWGTEHIHREASEHYTWAGRDTYRNFVEAIGKGSCELIHYETYTQDGYREALSDWAITDAETGRPWFPRTNAVWVFERGK